MTPAPAGTKGLTDLTFCGYGQCVCYGSSFCSYRSESDFKKNLHIKITFFLQFSDAGY